MYKQSVEILSLPRSMRSERRNDKLMNTDEENNFHVFVQLFIGSASTLGPDESEGASPSTQHPAQEVPHLHPPSGHPHAPPQHSSLGTSIKPQADRALSCRPPLPPKGSTIPPRSTENNPGGKTVMFVGSISAGRFFGGGGKFAARLRKVSIAPLGGGCCETCSGPGRATPPRRSTQ